MRCLCRILLIAALLLAWLGFCPPAEAVTIAHWRFEDSLLDESASGNDATHSGGSPAFSSAVFGSPVPRTGDVNTKTLVLANTPGGGLATDYLQVAHDPSLNIATGSFTMEAFVKLDNAGSDTIRQYVLQKNDIGPGDEASSFIFLAKAGNLIPTGQDQSVLALVLPDGVADEEPQENYIFSSLGIDNNNWHHISVAVDRSTGDVRFTLDDAVDLQLGAAAGAFFAGQNNDGTLLIGGHPTSSGATPINHGFDGLIDELRISDEYLATSQLLAVPEPVSLYTALSGVLLLLLAWRFRWTNRRT